ncbi:glycosyltransferase family 4 protein [Natronorarus salvus]|uniref:glycosyltransferase family 4 protein n=1 Tax=Natronorarus salvus TaxID=3117733 RepID=UPI002F26275B
MTTTKVCFISPSSYGYFTNNKKIAGGGAERQLYLLGNNLTDDFNVSFVVGDYGQASVESHENISLYRAHRPDPEKNPVSKIFLLAKAMSKTDADLYITRGNPQLAAITFLISRMVRSEWCFHVANDVDLTSRVNSLPLPVRYLFSYGIKNAKFIVVQTKRQHRLLTENFNRTGYLIPNGYNIPSDYDGMGTRNFYLWVGRLDAEQKRPHLYLEIAKELPEKKFVLIGSDDNDQKYSKLIKAKASKIPNLTYINGVAPDEIQSYYEGAIALVNTSSYEGFPNTFLEAWRVKTPVISLDVDPSRFISIDKNFNSYAKGELTTLIRSLRAIDKGNQREIIGVQSYNQFVNNYSINEISDLYASAIRNHCC